MLLVLFGVGVLTAQSGSNDAGAADGLYLRNGEIPTYGVDGTFGDMDDVRAYGKDERIGVKQYFEGLEFRYQLIKALSQI